MKKFLDEFKTFALRGNVMDMAVGVVIGSAFTAIVTSLVNDIFTPVIAALTSNVNFSELNIVLKDAGETQVTLNYGSFIQAVLNFVIVAFVIFMVIKAINKLKTPKEEEKKEEVPAKSAELLELEKITKLLKKQVNNK